MAGGSLTFNRTHEKLHKCQSILFYMGNLWGYLRLGLAFSDKSVYLQNVLIMHITFLKIRGI